MAVKVFFLPKEGEAQSVDLSLDTYGLLDLKARSLNTGITYVLLEVLEFYGQVTEVDVLNFLKMSSQPN
ncbi:MAG: hypothetical protein AAB461_02960 [Patescibacteria group bacterium]